MSTINGGWRGPNIVKDGLILYMDASSPNSYLNNVFGTTWKDISGNGNNGTLVNFGSQTIWNSSNGGSIVFDGTNDLVNNIGSLSTFSFVQNTGVYTISAWVKPSVLNKEMYIAGNSDNTGTKGFYFGTFGTGNITCYVLSGVNPSPLNHSVSNSFTATTEWVNIVAVGDGVKNQFYRNGSTFGSSLNFGAALCQEIVVESCIWVISQMEGFLGFGMETLQMYKFIIKLYLLRKYYKTLM